MFDLKGKKILVTGGHGFLGRHLIKQLENDFDDLDLLYPTHRRLDLCKEDLAESYIWDNKPDIIIHLAALVGGIKANQNQACDFFFNNLKMGMNVIKWSTLWEVKKLVVIGTVCSYPSDCPVPFKESDLWNGYLEPTNAPYGVAKKALLVLLQAARKQYGLNGIYLIPTNLYGPGDHFDLETSHAIPALVRKIYEAKINNRQIVEIWGTGEATREFLYVEDCVQGIIQALKFYDEPEPLNLGSGEEISIIDLAKLIAEIIGYEGQFKFNPQEPDGQLRRKVDWSKAKEKIGFEPRIKLNEGLRNTIDWFIESYNNVYK